MSNPIYETEKAKNKTRAKGSVWVSLLTLILLSPCLLIMGYIVLVQVAYNVMMSPFDLTEIAQTCGVLSLPSDSAFCRGSEPQNTEELQAIIEQMYPVGITRGELEERFNITFSYCDERGFCDVNLPINSVYLSVQFNDEGFALRYMIEDERGSGPW